MTEFPLLGSASFKTGLFGTEHRNTENRSVTDLFRVPRRYLRSVHLENDFCDPTTLNSYVITPSVAALFWRLLDAVEPSSTKRAWRITGDFGTGKSSFALVFAHLLRDPMKPELAHIRRAIEQFGEIRDLANTKMLPILVTGDRESLVPALARGISRVLKQLKDDGGIDEDLNDLEEQTERVVRFGKPSELPPLLRRLNQYSANKGFKGVLLVLDELGKFLEYAAFHPEQEDVYVLQVLAEEAARSGDHPLVVVALLHQNISAYAQGLPSTSRLEWAKVAGRFDEITLDQQLAHVVALVSGALNIDEELIPNSVADAIHRVRNATFETGWYGASPKYLSPLEMYPLHPTVLPVLVRFFARFGQHERSLFSFLLSSEPFGLQAFAERSADASGWYRLSDFYDYVRLTFGDRLAGGSYSSDWLRIVGTLDRLQHLVDVNLHELRVLKVVALLNLLDAEYLLPNRVVLEAALTDGDPSGIVSEALSALIQRGLLFDRGVAGGYCLWPSTSVDLGSAFEAAKREISPLDGISTLVTLFIERTSVVARRHYIETGTLRHFEVRYVDSEVLFEGVVPATESDGLVLVVLCDSSEQRNQLTERIFSCKAVLRPDVIVAVPPALHGITGEVVDALGWQWVADNTPELAHDSYAAAEVARQLSLCRRLLIKRLNSFCGFGDGDNSNSGVEWWHQGQRVVVPEMGGISTVVSNICDALYRAAPQVQNELINRRSLSSAAASARLRLIERMLSGAEEPFLGIDDRKSPPEKSMYLSLLREGKVHREEKGQLILAEPPKDSDPLNLRPALMRILSLIEDAGGRRVSVREILDELRGSPYGVRAGLAPVLLAIEIVAHTHEIAIYENGTFQPKVDSHCFMRLIKEPSAFEVQLCRVQGVRSEVFSLLAQAFADSHRNGRDMDLLDVVRPLAVFAAQLPEYTQRNSALEEPVRSVRDALFSAREPAPLLFEALPVACGLEPFPHDGPSNKLMVQRFVATLRDAVRILGSAYPDLLERIRERVSSGLGEGNRTPSRTEVTRRAAQVIISAREPRLQAFARCLADSTISDDAWAERIGSFAISKPPSRWTYAEEVRAIAEITALTEIFLRVEATAFGGFPVNPDVKAVRLGLTRGDGVEAARVVYIQSDDEPIVGKLAEEIDRILETRTDLKLAVISQVLWNNLERGSHYDEISDSANVTQQHKHRGDST